MLKEENLDINDFELKDDIGEGNFGKVKFCIYKKTGEEFAVKIINKKKIKDKMKNSFFKENEIATKFNHINVIYVFRIIEDQENFYLVMEYCQRGELFDYIVQHQRLSENESAIFFYQLINGVEYIHSQGIAHRDLKPENLLLTNDKTLKIIDFGLSHEFDPACSLLKTKCGSPSYAAPEIISCPFYDGFKTDIWCCGIILYAMLCGFLPFEGENNSELFRNILDCDPEMPDWLSISSRDLIIRILNPDPDERITLKEIKKHKFYLKGKKLCTINYDDINSVIKARKLKIDRNKDINDIFKMEKNNNDKNNEKINKKENNIKIKYCNTINSSKVSKTKPSMIKNINMKNNNSINTFKKKQKKLKIKEKNNEHKNMNINIKKINTSKTQKKSLETNNSPIKNYNIGKEYNITEFNNINNNLKKLSIKKKFSSILSRINSAKKPLFLKILNNNVYDKSKSKIKTVFNEGNNEQRNCSIILNKLRDNFRKLNHQKKLIINDINYIHTINPASSKRFISNSNLKQKNDRIKSLRDHLNGMLSTENNVSNQIKSRSVRNNHIKTNSNRIINRKSKKINLINNLYSKPIVYFDNLSININNINVHQKAYNNIRNSKNKNKSKDYDYKKRNNTINPKKPKYQINFDDLILKSDFNTKYSNEENITYNIKTKKQIRNKKIKKF